MLIVHAQQRAQQAFGCSLALKHSHAFAGSDADAALPLPFPNCYSDEGHNTTMVTFTFLCCTCPAVVQTGTLNSMPHLCHAWF